MQGQQIRKILWLFKRWACAPNSEKSELQFSICKNNMLSNLSSYTATWYRIACRSIESGSLLGKVYQRPMAETSPCFFHYAGAWWFGSPDGAVTEAGDWWLRIDAVPTICSRCSVPLDPRPHQVAVSLLRLSLMFCVSTSLVNHHSGVLIRARFTSHTQQVTSCGFGRVFNCGLPIYRLR